MEDDRLLERERRRIEQILQLDYEALQVEEVDDDFHDSSDDDSNDSSDDDSHYSSDDDSHDSSDDDSHDSSDDDRDATGSESSNPLSFDTCLASSQTYFGEVVDTRHRMAFLEGGAILNLPLFYLQGVVLFPEATLPLRVVQPHFIDAVERALSQVDAPYTLGVVRLYRDPDNNGIRFSTTGTTAEIRQYQRCGDTSFNVVTRGQQRFRLRRYWMDEEEVPYGEVQIIQEDVPLKTPRDAVDKFGSVKYLQSQIQPHTLPLNSSSRSYSNGDNDSDATSEESSESELSPAERKIHQSFIDSTIVCDIIDESTSSNDDHFAIEPDSRSKTPRLNDTHSIDNWKRHENVGLGIRKRLTVGRQSYRGEGSKICSRNEVTQFCRTSSAFMPYWVYRMYDSYCLAERAADKWKQIVGTPNMDGLVKKPDLLSFHIASKIPISGSTRQELLEIDGVSYRLRREIELLESYDLVRCRTCKTAIGRRSDMFVMASEVPLGAYVNPHAFVHEILTLNKANGLALYGRAKTEYSWFPGYAWTIASCSTCETHVGWLFTAVKAKLMPKSFWGIRSSQVDETTGEA